MDEKYLRMDLLRFVLCVGIFGSKTFTLKKLSHSGPLIRGSTGKISCGFQSKVYHLILQLMMDRQRALEFMVHVFREKQSGLFLACNFA